MKPTLKPGDRVLLRKYKFSFKLNKCNRGDIIVFKSPIEDDKRYFIKRIIGIEGDKINIINGKLYLDNKHHKENYIEKNSFIESILNGKNYMVPKREIYVLGDNRSPRGSDDSRSFRTIPLENIKGKTVMNLRL